MGIKHGLTLIVCPTFLFFCLAKTNPDLLKEFPNPKNLLSNTLARSLGVNDLSQLIQYNWTEQAGVKVRTKVVMAHLVMKWSCLCRAELSSVSVLFSLCREPLSRYCGPARLKRRVLPRKSLMQSDMLRLLLASSSE